ncbi:MraY family glycosyltransferase [Pseudaquabacterium pictum]|uniref:Glycosyl transferase n=1 Tax=Pseudaquabacterium pictum TaxID=2315236 RepID=A0A480ARN7_9BURK|nr:glycosyltransferase [Rubrivivax pictus]GCL63500.1 glycosyl transferase [Rubrivivax pictus]
MLVLLVAFALSTGITLMLVRAAKVGGHRLHDHDLSGPQKFHSAPVPRVGGIGIFLGVFAGLLVFWLRQPEIGSEALLLMACAIPAFGCGLTEDLTKTQSPRRRLFFTAVSAALAVVLLSAVIDRTDIPGLDWAVSFAGVAAAVTVFVVAGVANSLNIIDGFNGLASMCAVLILASIGYVAFQVDDMLVVALAVAGVGAVLGFFVWNFPAGLIFLGDGGAYFLGFYVAELAILLLHRNATVSPMFPLLVCIYPVFETVFSIYRRVMLRGQPAGMPDGIHLHSLIYRRIMRWAIGKQSKRSAARRNSMTSPYLWMLCMTAVVPAMLFWDSTPVLGGFIVLFGVTYTALYWRIVRFRAPRWMITNR